MCLHFKICLPLKKKTPWFLHKKRASFFGHFMFFMPRNSSYYPNSRHLKTHNGFKTSTSPIQKLIFHIYFYCFQTMGNMVSYFVAKNLLQDRYFLFDDLEGEHSILFAIYVSKAKIQVWEGLKINTQTQKSPWIQLHLKQKGWIYCSTLFPILTYVIWFKRWLHY